MPKVNLGKPSIVSKPTVAINNPKAPASMKPLMRLLSSEREIMIVRPRTATIKYSGGPKDRAKDARGGSEREKDHCAEDATNKGRNKSYP
ncbi:hypothetical protein [Acetomicrobium sp.]|uniref:hypothetical protein n=1 Tax=Acetomicrobium sp. TaxID=1872099 RepID=UPI002FC68750